MQSDATAASRIAATASAVAPDFEPANHNMKMAVPLDLAFQAIKQIALKLGDASAAEASHMDVVALRPPLVEVLFSLQVHQIEFIN
jgi:hypothetical protein